jgi:polysaccharide biosynthesis transport protein
MPAAGSIPGGGKVMPIIGVGNRQSHKQMLQTDKTITNERADGERIARSALPSADTFKATVDFIRRRYLVIAFATAIAIALGLVYLITAAPKFTATSTMMIDTKKVQLFGQQSIFSELPVDTSAVESQVEILKSETIALAVIKKLHLTDDPEFVGGGGLISTLFGAVAGLFASSEPSSEFTLQREAVATFKNRLEVKRVGLSYIILISFTSLSPDRAAQIANAVADAYIDD